MQASGDKISIPVERYEELIAFEERLFTARRILRNRSNKDCVIKDYVIQVLEDVLFLEGGSNG